MRAPRVALSLAVAGTIAALPANAAASTFDASGWWWRAQTGLLVDVPAPPDVPEDGFAVGAAPDGPTEVAAVRYRLDEDERDPVLTLRVEEERGGEAAGVVACGTGDHWGAAHGGRWDDRPECAQGAATVAGVRADDGGSWTFELAPVLDEDGVIDVVLAPAEGPAPFRITFQPLSDADLRTTRGQEDEAFEAPPVSAFVPEDAPAEPPPPVAVAAPAPAPVRQGEAPPIVAGPKQAPVAAPAAAPPPVPEALVAPAAPGLDPTWLAVSLLALVALVAYDLRRQDVPPPRKLGRLGGAVPEEPVRGLGRFARPRSDAPKPLL